MNIMNVMAEDPRTWTEDEIARHMGTGNSPIGLKAGAELERRRSRYMRASAIATSISAAGAAIAAIVATLVAVIGCR